MLRLLARLGGTAAAESVRRRLASRLEPPPPRFRVERSTNSDKIAKWWRDRGGRGGDVLADPRTLADVQAYSANVENMIGTVKLPVGVAGPLRVNGLHAQGDYLVPLAT